MADEERTQDIITTGPNGQDFTFYALPSEFADFSKLTQEQAQQLVNIMTLATEQGLDSVNYTQFVSNPERAASVQVAERQENNAPLSGFMGAVVRGAGPIAAGTAIGAGIGSVVPGIGTLTGAAAGAMSAAVTDVVGPLLISLSNNILGRNDPDPRAAWNNLMDAVGVDPADEGYERIITNMSRAAATAGMGVVGMNAAINVLSSQTPLGTTFGTNVLKAMASGPASQIIGAAGSEVGLAASKAIGERNDLGPWAQAGLDLALGMAGDMTGGVLGNVIDARVPVLPGQMTINTARQSMDIHNITPESARAAITAGEQLDVPVMRSDIFPPSSTRGRQVQSAMESAPFGTGAPRRAQQIARNQAMIRELAEFDTPMGRASTPLTQELADSFINPRQEAFNTLSEMKSTALSSVPENTIIDVSETLDFIDNQIEYLTRIGGANADPNIATSPGMSEADAAATNVYQGLLNRLTRWRAAFQNKTLPELETNRANFGEAFIPEGGYGKIATQQERDIVSGVYDSIRNDITNAVRQYGGDDAAERLLEANSGMFELMRDLDREVVSDFVQRVNAARLSADAPLETLTGEAQQSARMMVQAHPEMIEKVALTGSPSDVRTVLQYLDSNGRDLMISTILRDSVARATPDIRNTSGNTLANNLDEVLTQIANIDDQLSLRGITLTEEETTRLAGLRNVLDFTRHAELSTHGSSPTSATQVLGGLIPGGQLSAGRMVLQSGIPGVGAWLATLVTGGGFARIYESPAMRDILLEAATAGLDSTRMERLAREMIRVMSSSVGSQGTSAGAN